MEIKKVGNWTLTNDVLGYNNGNLGVTIPISKEILQDLKCLLQPKLVGYQLEVEGEYFDFNGIVDPFQIFKSHKDIQEWLNAYGTLCGLDENTNVKLVDIYEDDIEEYSFVGNIPKDASEYCPHCDAEVEIANKFIPQVCPNCGEIILPCNMCFDCKDCPFGGNTCKSKYFKTWTWEYNINRFVLK